MKIQFQNKNIVFSAINTEYFLLPTEVCIRISAAIRTMKIKLLFAAATGKDIFSENMLFLCFQMLED